MVCYDIFWSGQFGSAPDQFRAKTAVVGVCSTFTFATETTVEKRKHCEKDWFLALSLEELVRRQGCY